MNGPKVAKFLVGQVKCEPVPAYIGGARTASCGRARVVPREVVSREIDPVSTEAMCQGLQSKTQRLRRSVVSMQPTRRQALMS